MYKGSVMLEQGKLTVKGLKDTVTVRRDEMGIPFIEANTRQDLAFATGYINSSDRLNQMVTLKLISQGRLSEMAGQPVLEIDKYMRTLNLNKAAGLLYDEISEENKKFLECYAQGVNAYLEQHKDNLPPELSLNGYIPDTWEAYDSITILAFVGLSLSFNLHEEIGSLAMAQSIGPDKTAWVLPVYPDEPIPLDEARKLEGIDLKGMPDTLQGVGIAAEILTSMGLSGVAASNNWAVSGQRAAGKASILANDAHLFLSLPSMWNMMHLRCNDMDVVGFGIAGIPCIISGYNGYVAWGQTMVMADNQDVFLEKLRKNNGKLEYLYKGKWVPTTEREEIIKVRKKDPVRIIVHETIHGPLLNDIITKEPINHFLTPGPVEMPFGLALSWAAFEPGDKTGEAYINLSKAKSVPEALGYIRDIQAISLNIVVADRDNIAWQVTGRYPIRKKGRGLMPSPGWNGEYDWTGYLDLKDFPSSLNPPEGYVATGNNRTVPMDHPHVLSSSWYWPDRVERIRELITSKPVHTYKQSMEMQLDTRSMSSSRIRKVFLSGPLSGDIMKEIEAWKDKGIQEDAREALEILESFDNDMTADSKGALMIGTLMHILTRDIFLDELGPEDSSSWKGFIASNYITYSAVTDHIVVRGDESPLWDDIRTKSKEVKAEILARSLVHAIRFIEEKLGKDRGSWTWGRLHKTNFKTESSKMAKRFNIVDRTAMKLFGSFFNRGPFPASGDHTTLNVSAYIMGQDFDTWLIPSMRMVVDFNQEEPFFAVNSTGQSDNPASPHYEDGISAWRKGEYLNLPFAKHRIEKHYRKVLLLNPDHIEVN
jgi:acyl-homoserine-lactone acylase